MFTSCLLGQSSARGPAAVKALANQPYLSARMGWRSRKEFESGMKLTLRPIAAGYASEAHCRRAILGSTASFRSARAGASSWMIATLLEIGFANAGHVHAQQRDYRMTTVTCEPRQDGEVEVIGFGRLNQGEAAVLIAEIARAARDAHTASGKPPPTTGASVEAALNQTCSHAR